MHTFFNAVGLGAYRTRGKLNELEELILSEADWERVYPDGEETRMSAARFLGEDFGVAMSGIFEDRTFYRDSMVPFFLGKDVTVRTCTSLQRTGDGRKWLGMCEEPGLGLSLIYFLQNSAETIRKKVPLWLPKDESVVMAALAENGKVLLPVEEREATEEEESVRRQHQSLLEQARGGDEKAIEILTMEDMELYSAISERLKDEDVYSIVDTSFMPCGMECDRYTVVGRIEDITDLQNELTGENLLRITVSCKDLRFPVLIHEKDLLGEPAPGRRFKGDIWMQGTLVI